jgi:hypothetical protein
MKRIAGKRNYRLMKRSSPERKHISITCGTEGYSDHEINIPKDTVALISFGAQGYGTVEIWIQNKTGITIDTREYLKTLLTDVKRSLGGSVMTGTIYQPKSFGGEIAGDWETDGNILMQNVSNDNLSISVGTRCIDR